jgi:hypothetical protein
MILDGCILLWIWVNHYEEIKVLRFYFRRISSILNKSWTGFRLHFVNFWKRARAKGTRARPFWGKKGTGQGHWFWELAQKSMGQGHDFWNPAQKGMGQGHDFWKTGCPFSPAELVRKLHWSRLLRRSIIPIQSIDFAFYGKLFIILIRCLSHF